MLETVTATRFAVPLREGGSLPGLVDADDLGMYVVKFRGAGQGLQVLVAEVLVGEIARTLGIPVPRLAVVDPHGVLLGLLCLKRSRRGFCSAEDVAARERERRLAG